METFLVLLVVGLFGYGVYRFVLKADKSVESESVPAPDAPKVDVVQPVDANTVDRDRLGDVKEVVSETNTRVKKRGTANKAEAKKIRTRKSKV
jgi:hypothetical protein